MNNYELWIMVVGGESDDERVIYDGDSWEELEQAVLDVEDEVQCDPDKYFELIMPYGSPSNRTFYSYDDFLKIAEGKMEMVVTKILEGADVRKILL